MSHSSKQVAESFYGTVDFAVMEAARITEEGHLVLSSGVGNNVDHLDHASHIIVEVNTSPTTSRRPSSSTRTWLRRARCEADTQQDERKPGAHAPGFLNHPVTGT